MTVTLFDYCVSVIFESLKNGFSTVQQAFSSIGLDWAAVVGGLAVMSMVLRSFYRVFIGDSMDVGMMSARKQFFTTRKDRANSGRSHSDTNSSAPRRLNAGNPRTMLGDGSATYRNRHKSNNRRFTWK